ncbi:hypothetical protein Tco_0283669, partial [Tanacetum coccineum]
ALCCWAEAERGLIHGLDQEREADCNPMQSGRVGERSSSSCRMVANKKGESKQQLLIRDGDQKNTSER